MRDYELEAFVKEKFSEMLDAWKGGSRMREIMLTDEKSRSLQPTQHNNTDYTLNKEEMQVLSLLSEYTKEHPLTKNEILNRGFGYRQIRRVMTDLRNKGVRVVSLGRGFFVAETNEEYGIYRAIQIKRINSLQKQLKAMDSIAEGQIGL